MLMMICILKEAGEERELLQVSNVSGILLKDLQVTDQQSWCHVTTTHPPLENRLKSQGQQQNRICDDDDNDRHCTNENAQALHQDSSRKEHGSLVAQHIVYLSAAAVAEGEDDDEKGMNCRNQEWQWHWGIIML